MPEKLIAQVADNGLGTFIAAAAAGLAGFGWQLWRTKRADGFAKERNDFAAKVGLSIMQINAGR